MRKYNPGISAGIIPVTVCDLDIPPLSLTAQMLVFVLLNIETFLKFPVEEYTGLQLLPSLVLKYIEFPLANIIAPLFCGTPERLTQKPEPALVTALQLVPLLVVLSTPCSAAKPTG